MFAGLIETETWMLDDHLIRTAGIEDIPDIVKIRVLLQGHMEARNPALWALSRKHADERPAFYRKMIEDPDAKLIVIEDENSRTIIGMALGRKMRHDEYVPEKSGRIDDVWIDPAHRRKGLCTALVTKLIEFFAEDNIEALVLDYAHGNTEAEAVWSKLGFQVVIKTAVADISKIKSTLSK